MRPCARRAWLPFGQAARPAPVTRRVRPVLDLRGPTYQIDALQVLGGNLMPKNKPQKMIFESGQGKSAILGLVHILARQAAKDEFKAQNEERATKDVTDASHDEDPHTKCRP